MQKPQNLEFTEENPNKGPKWKDKVRCSQKHHAEHQDHRWYNQGAW